MEVDVGVGVAEIVTGIQFRSSWARVPDGVAVPAEAWQEAYVVPAILQETVPVLVCISECGSHKESPR